MDVLDLIENAVDGLCACGCGTQLSPDGPSAYYASPECQRRYLARQASDPEEVRRRPDAAPVYVGRDSARVPLREVARRPQSSRMRGASPTLVIIDEPFAADHEALAAFAAAAAEQATAQLAAFFGALRPVFEELGRAMQALAEHLQPLMPEQPPEDPMARALWLRRNRNTGPKSRQRAPRRIDARGAR